LIASERVTWVSEGLSLPASAAVSDSARQCGEERSEQERSTRRANLVPCKEHVRRKFTVQEITMIHLCLVFSAQLARLPIRVCRIGSTLRDQRIALFL
jgi:hypothetical protein